MNTYLKMPFTKIALLIVSAFLLNSCAAMQAQMEEDQRNHAARVCSYDGAFEEGANDGRGGFQMRGQYVSESCQSDVRAQVMAGYRAGYREGSSQKTQPPPPPTRVIIVNPQPPIGQLQPVQPARPGYGNTYPTRPGNTYPSQPGSVYPAQGYPPARARECINSFGAQTCGYGCKEAYGRARCAQNPRYTCMASFGDITCGLNCRETYGRVVCDEQE